MKESLKWQISEKRKKKEKVKKSHKLMKKSEKKWQTSVKKS